ncbi:hypothetical protein OS493_008546 [Desmophyllum pertusum]|uniref:Fibronectin type-III domain-containing protein n=1 Tax=Desmophyllum pertusum TaxID=174260 RepID=A0A9W9ZR82_9CNID|nr:hypothetical protein OS493_008546 [Desmophyllum pertusum]
MASTSKGDGNYNDPLTDETNQDNTWRHRQTKTVRSKELSWKGLDKFSVYNIRVLAATIKGDGPPSDPIFVYTDEDKPSKAPVLTVVKTLNSTSIPGGMGAVPPQNMTWSYYQFWLPTVKGNGPPSDPKTATTEDPPTPPPLSDDDIGTTEVSIDFVNKQMLSNGKPVRFYQIIVIPLQDGQNPGKSSDGKIC